MENALQWFGDFHVDALRLDAVHGIVDTTATPFLAELSEATDARSATELGRRLVLIAESADNNPRVVTPAAVGGLGHGRAVERRLPPRPARRADRRADGYYADFGDSTSWPGR